MFSEAEMRGLRGRIAALDLAAAGGWVTACSSAQLAATAPGRSPAAGDAWLVAPDGPMSRRGGLLAEVVRAEPGQILLAPYGEPRGIAPGAWVRPAGAALELRPHEGWLGRVIDPLGRPLDGRGQLVPGPRPAEIMAAPPPALARGGLGPRLPLGVRALDLFVPCCEGQRLGVFAGSGVGKSSLLSMIARGTDAEISVIALVGERGREVREFLENDLGPDGLARSVVVVATSDAPPVCRLRAAFVATRIAEWFRDSGRDVVLMMDSLTRVAMAQREIGLSAGEPPATRGYPPSVFTLLPRLLERAGTSDHGSITGLYTVLVEGDDLQDPIGDTARSILDGHVVLDRRLATAGHFPSIDVLESISRVTGAVTTREQREHATRLRRLLAAHRDVRELVEIGAYVSGADPDADAALALLPRIDAFLRQELDDVTPLADAWERLRDLVGRSPAMDPAERSPAMDPAGGDR